MPYANYYYRDPNDRPCCFLSYLRALFTRLAETTAVSQHVIDETGDIMRNTLVAVRLCVVLTLSRSVVTLVLS